MFNRKASYGLALLSGILLLLSFPPFDLEFLAWIAFVPLLITIFYETKFKRIEKLAFITFAIVFVPQWLEPWYTEMLFILPTLPNWVMILIAVGGGLLISGFISETSKYWKPKHLPAVELQYLPSSLKIFVLPVMWTCTEFLIMSLPLVMKVGGAFGYLSFSGTQWRNAPILHLASFTGIYGVTFLILLVNCALAHAIVHFKEHRKIYKPAIVVLLILLGVFGWGALSIPQPVLGDVNVVVIQTSEEGTATLYSDLANKSLKYNPQIIVWGVSGGPNPLDQLEDFSAAHNVCLLNGTELLSPDKKRSQHSITYHFMNFLEGFRPLDINKIVSPQIQGFETEFGKVGSLICQESASSIPARKLVEDGTNLLTTTSMNEGFAWAGLFGGNAVYRAVEYGTPAVSYRPWGGSIIIDTHGRIVEDIAPEEEIIAGKISFTNERTFYTKYGDVFGWAVVGLAFLLAGCNFYLKRKSPFKYCEKCGAEIKKDAETCDKCGASQKKPPFWKRILLHEYHELRGG